MKQSSVREKFEQTKFYPQNQLIGSEKGAISSTSGTVVKNQLYPSRINNIVHETEHIGRSGGSSVNANSNFGTTVVVKLPSSQFTGTTFLRMQLPAALADTYLPQGWGLHAVQKIKYIIGSRSSSDVTRENYFMRLMAECNSDIRRSFIINAAGSVVNGAQALGTTNEAVIPILTPFSSIASENSPLPIDSASLQTPVEIHIQFAPPANFISGAGRDLFVASCNNTFSIAEIYCREIAVTSRSFKSVLSEEIKGGQRMIPYHHNSTGGLQRNITCVAGTPQTVSIGGIENADLTYFSFYIVENTSLSAPTKVEPLQMGNSVELADIELSRTGTTYLRSPGHSQLERMFSANDDKDSDAYLLHVRAAAGDTEPFFTNTVLRRIYAWSVAAHRPTNNSRLSQSTPSFYNNDFTLLFTPSVTANCTLYCLYLYNESVILSQGVGSFIR